MRIGNGKHVYEWIDGWAKIPDTESARTGFAHSDMVVTGGGELITFHPGDPELLAFDKDGNLLRSSTTGLTNAHGIAIVQEGEAEYLWLADDLSGQVVKTTLDGRTVLSLERPELAIYQAAAYSPTSVAVNEERHGGNGDVWVADGYGESYLHRYSKSGEYICSVNGEERRAGAFQQPHGLWFDTRRSEPELYIADRLNQRVQVYDADGHFKRAFGSDFLTRPGGFATHGEFMIMGEHRGSRLTIVDGEDRFVCYLGENPGVSDREDWPDIPAELFEPGKFSSPHGQAVDSEGNLYVTELLIGGRHTKLAKTDSGSASSADSRWPLELRS